MIRAEGLCKKYEGLEVLRDVSVHIEKGEHVALIGASGSGKSVFMRCLNALEKPDAGRVFIGGRDLASDTDARKLTGMVFQQFNLFTHLNTIDNVALAPIHAYGVPPKEAFERAEALLELVGLSDKRMAYPAELSGGQMQRVAIARALAVDPPVLLFDEPTSALDPSMSGEVLSVIGRIAREADKTMLVITHELQFVREIADRVLFLADCGIYEEGRPDELLVSPKREKTRAFLENL